MIPKILAIDVSNLAHRAFHSIGSLSYDGESTEVLYGVLRTVLELKEMHNISHIAWCFDGGYDKRLEIYSRYKESRAKNRKEMDDEEKTARRSLRRQIYRLRTELLYEAGFRNILWQEGYEADDLIASVCFNVKKGGIVIVSSDSDLLQLLSPWVIVWNPLKKKPVTAESFVKQWGIGPFQWADVKAIAGCRTDDVPGVAGVAEKTAVKFLTGTLKETTKAFQNIVKSSDLWKRNIQLTRLPFSDVDKFELKDDEVTKGSWNKMAEGLGMKSLIGRMR